MIAERRRSPFASGVERTGSSPPSPVFERAPRRFMRDREGLVGLARDRAERHRTRREATHDLAGRLDLRERDRLAGRHQLEQAAQRRRLRRGLVDRGRVRLVGRVALVAHGALQLRDDVGVPDVVLALDAELVEAAGLESLPLVGGALAGCGIRRDPLEPDTADARRRAGEVAGDDRGPEADGLEDLRAAVALDGRDPHLREHLQEPLADALHEALLRLVDGQLAEVAGGLQRGDRVEREVGRDGGGAVADQERDVHDLARLARLDDEAAARARALAYEVAVNGGGCEEDRDRAARRVGSAVREHEDRVLRPHETRGLLAEVVERPLEPPGALARVEQALERADAEAVGWQRAQLLEVARQQDGLGHRDPPGVLGRLVEEVPLRADGRAEAHHERLALRVDRGVGDLGEVLLEVGRKQLRPIGERGERRVDAHRAHGLLALDRHRRDHEPQVLSRVPEQPLEPLELGRRRLHGLAVRHVLEVDLLRVEQGAVRPAARERVLQLVVADDPPGHRVDEQHPPRLEAVVDDDVARIQVEHPRLGGEHEQAVPRQRVARRAQAVAIERRADLAAVGEGDRRRAVPRLQQRGVELVERADVVRHLGVVRPRRRDQHRQGVRGWAARHHEQLERGVEGCRVGPALLDDREQLREVVAEQRGAQARLARVHPRAVATHRVDLAVVGEVVERLREIPRSERVRREARVHERDRRLHGWIQQVGVVRAELRRAMQALVGQRRVGEARDREDRLADLARRQRELDAAADHVELAAERVGRDAASARRRRAVGSPARSRAPALRCGRCRPGRRASRSGSAPPRAWCARGAPRRSAAARDRGEGSTSRPRTRPAGAARCRPPRAPSGAGIRRAAAAAAPRRPPSPGRRPWHPDAPSCAGPRGPARRVSDRPRRRRERRSRDRTRRGRRAGRTAGSGAHRPQPESTITPIRSDQLRADFMNHLVQSG